MIANPDDVLYFLSLSLSSEDLSEIWLNRLLQCVNMVMNVRHNKLAHGVYLHVAPYLQQCDKEMSAIYR